VSDEWVWKRVEPDLNDPRFQAAVTELKTMITAAYPDATFVVERDEDLDGIYIWATVDIDDPEPVGTLVLKRELDMRVEYGLPIYVIPLTTLERSQRIYREEHPDLAPRSSRA
jgi:hypothetical protein